MPPPVFGYPFLLVAWLALWVLGIILLFAGQLMKPKTKGVAVDKPIWLQILKAILLGFVAALKPVTSPKGMWDFLMGLGPPRSCGRDCSHYLPS